MVFKMAGRYRAGTISRLSATACNLMVEYTQRCGEVLITSTLLSDTTRLAVTQE